VAPVTNVVVVTSPAVAIEMSVVPVRGWVAAPADSRCRGHGRACESRQRRDTPDGERRRGRLIGPRDRDGPGRDAARKDLVVAIAVAPPNILK
jgi:hypothetical protein